MYSNSLPVISVPPWSTQKVCQCDVWFQEGEEEIQNRFEIPAKKWGDTEIAERGRSVLVMRARYRSAGLIPHQRGWTDAG